MSEPINLNDLYGTRFRITWEASAYYKHDRTPWMMEIKGKYGTIYPFSDKLLAVECDHHHNIQRKLVELGLELHQDGDYEKTYLFSPEKFTEVSTIIKAYKKFQLSPENKLAASLRLQKVRGSKVI